MEVKTTATISEARDYLGANNVFGFDEWEKYFPGMVKLPEDKLEEIRDIPWPKATILNPETACGENLGEHFLFLGIEKTTSDMKLNLFSWLAICQNAFGNTSGGPKFTDPIKLRNWLMDDWRAPRPIGVDPDHYTVRTCSLRWYFMPKNVLKSSLQKYNVSRPAEYEGAEAVEVVTANILYYLLNIKYMPMVLDGVRTKSVSVSNYGQDICVWLENEKLTIGTFPPGKYPGAALWRAVEKSN